jgi:16S rRNA (guanine1207-N2)-methyltransferase
VATWRDDPDGAADALIVDSLEDLGLPPADTARVLLVDVGPGLRRKVFDEQAWRGCAVARRASASDPAPQDQPPTAEHGTYNVAFLRLAKSKDELESTAHRMMAWLAPQSRVYIYGGNDEGIRSAAKRLANLNVPIETVAAHSHGRVLALQRPDDLAQVKTRDEQWRTVRTLDFGDGTLKPWISYPGLFAGGALDAATAFLLAHVSALPFGATVLDYGCGTGIIARALLERDPTAKVTALDVDTFALEATRENAPGARTLLSHRLKGSGRHDVIVSNPPIHNGFREDHTTLHQMIEDAPNHLLPKGRLLFVVQRRVPAEAQLKAQFETVEIIADDGPFRIWSASRPVKQPGTRAKAPAPKLPGPTKYGDIDISDDVEDW